MKSILFNKVDLFPSGQFQRYGVIVVNERVVETVIFIRKLDGRGIKYDALLYTISLRKRASGDIADDDLQGNNGYFFYYCLPFIQFLDRKSVV